MNTVALQEWVTQNKDTAGVLALGIHAPGASNFVEGTAPGFLPDALEKAWRAVIETISVLQLNRFPTARFRFVYAGAFVHCERRRDGACLGVFAERALPAAAMERLVSEFHAI